MKNIIFIILISISLAFSVLAKNEVEAAQEVVLEAAQEVVLEAAQEVVLETAQEVVLIVEEEVIREALAMIRS